MLPRPLLAIFLFIQSFLAQGLSSLYDYYSHGGSNIHNLFQGQDLTPVFSPSIK